MNATTVKRLSALTIPAALMAAGLASARDWEGWSAMREHVTTAETLLRAEMSNGFNEIGAVSNLVLTADGRQVQYVLYDVPFPYSFFGGEQGFVSYDHVTLQPGSLGQLELVYDSDESVQAPEQLKLSRAQAGNRLVSDLIGDSIYFPNGSARAVEDLLIDRKTGDVEAWVVEMNPDTLFRDARRAIPADSVTVKEGKISSSMTMNEVENDQTYDSDYL